MTSYPDDVRLALDLLIYTTRDLNYHFAGCIICPPEEGKKPLIMAVGNVKELHNPAEFSQLLRMYADLIDSASTRGDVTVEKPIPIQ